MDALRPSDEIVEIAACMMREMVVRAALPVMLRRYT